MLGRDVTSHVWEEGQRSVSRSSNSEVTLTEALHVGKWVR